MSFHINPKTGEPGACKARKGKCPFAKLDEHFASASLAREAFEAANAAFSSEDKVKELSEAAQLALTSTLEWSGKKPRWMKSLEKNQNKLFGSKPTIIATLPSPVGELAVVWEQDSNSPNDEDSQLEGGYELNRLTFNRLIDGKQLGYLKLSSRNDASIERSFGKSEWQEFLWADESLGSSFGVYKYEEAPDGSIEKTSWIDKLSGQALVEEKRELWAKAHSALHKNPPNFDSSQLTWGSLVDLKASHSPESVEELDSDIAELRSDLRVKLEEAKEWSNDPAVDFVRVEDSLKGKGFGHALYIFGARVQATQGRRLRASGVQTADAEKSWRLMEKLGLPVGVTTKTLKLSSSQEQSSEFFTLDFRE